jgi:hypothetical protein
MQIITCNFTNKRETKNALRKLANINCLVIKQYKEKTIYEPNIHEIHYVIYKCNDTIIKNILNISHDQYLTTSIIYEVTFDFFG